MDRERYRENSLGDRGGDIVRSLVVVVVVVVVREREGGEKEVVD